MRAQHHVVIRSKNPQAVALATMRKTALEASRTWAIRELASRIATRAGPRDYVGQLRKIYEFIIARWRYVMEPEEFVHGTASSALKHVLGTKYNAPGEDPTMVDLDAMPLREHGWGDCDDVATIAASMVMAIGLKAFFRVAQASTGAHVSVVARLPTRMGVSVDPVGYPKHKFGWAMPAPKIGYYDVQTGQMVSVQE
jgi:hypothetical protein